MRLLVDLGVVFFALCGGTAAGVGLAHHFAGGTLDRLAPRWRARLRFAGLTAPPLLGLLGVCLAILPSALHLAGLGGDHCLNENEHNHAHLCLLHAPSGVSSLLAAVVAAFAALLLTRLTLALLAGWQARRIFASVLATSTLRQTGAAQFAFESDVPVCVTTGVFRPTIYISSAAIDALGPECVDAALAHERGHVRRHDTRARFVGSLLEAFHVPMLGRELAHHWHEDSEFLCDQYAAKLTDSTTVAEALVRFRRALHETHTGPALAEACLCASDSSLNARVRVLLAADQSAAEETGSVALALGAILLGGGIALQARHLLHHSLESFVGFVAALTN